jgi:hypothetical protein
MLKAIPILAYLLGVCLSVASMVLLVSNTYVDKAWMLLIAAVASILLGEVIKRKIA